MLIVICGTQGSEYIRERKLSDSGWNETVIDIANGQFEDVTSVIQCSTGDDVLPSLAKLVMDKWFNNDEPLSEWQESFIADHVRSRRSLPPSNIRPVSLKSVERV